MQKADLDKDIELLTNEITDLKKHIDRYDADIERLMRDKE